MSCVRSIALGQRTLRFTPEKNAYRVEGALLLLPLNHERHSTRHATVIMHGSKPSKHLERADAIDHDYESWMNVPIVRTLV